MHEEDIPIDFEDEPKEVGKPFKLIVGLFILLILVFSFIPYYVMKLDPNPNYDALSSVDIEDLIPDTRGHASSVQNANVDISKYRVIAVKVSTESCSFENKVCYAKALFYFVQDRTQYVKDPDRQYVQLPSDTLVSGGGDCEDHAILLASLLEAIGMDADVGLTQDHAFVRVQLPEAMWRYKADEDYVDLDTTGDNTFGEFKFKSTEIKSFVEL
jgi:hypothetical protein